MLDAVSPILETTHWKVIVSNDQEILGRCVIVCKENVGEMGRLTGEQWLDFGQLVQRLESAAKKAFGAIMCNWTCLMNLAYRHTPPDPQVHWHFRPRYAKTIEFAGLTFTDQQFGNHYPLSTNRDVGLDVMKEIFEAYKKALE